jgi:hypothetical protein
VFLLSLERGYFAQSWCSSAMKMWVAGRIPFQIKSVLNG